MSFAVLLEKRTRPSFIAAVCIVILTSQLALLSGFSDILSVANADAGMWEPAQGTLPAPSRLASAIVWNGTILTFGGCQGTSKTSCTSGLSEDQLEEDYRRFREARKSSDHNNGDDEKEVLVAPPPSTPLTPFSLYDVSNGATTNASLNFSSPIFGTYAAVVASRHEHDSMKMFVIRACSMLFAPVDTQSAANAATANVPTNETSHRRDYANFLASLASKHAYPFKEEVLSTYEQDVTPTITSPSSFSPQTTKLTTIHTTVKMSLSDDVLDLYRRVSFVEMQDIFNAFPSFGEFDDGKMAPIQHRRPTPTTTSPPFTTKGNNKYEEEKSTREFAPKNLNAVVGDKGPTIPVNPVYAQLSLPIANASCVLFGREVFIVGGMTLSASHIIVRYSNSYNTTTITGTTNSSGSRVLQGKPLQALSASVIVQNDGSTTPFSGEPADILAALASPRNGVSKVDLARDPHDPAFYVESVATIPDEDLQLCNDPEMAVQNAPVTVTNVALYFAMICIHNATNSSSGGGSHVPIGAPPDVVRNVTQHMQTYAVYEDNPFDPRRTYTLAPIAQQLVQTTILDPMMFAFTPQMCGFGQYLYLTSADLSSIAYLDLATYEFPKTWSYITKTGSVVSGEATIVGVPIMTVTGSTYYLFAMGGVLLLPNGTNPPTPPPHMMLEGAGGSSSTAPSSLLLLQQHGLTGGGGSTSDSLTGGNIAIVSDEIQLTDAPDREPSPLQVIFPASSCPPVNSPESTCQGGKWDVGNMGEALVYENRTFLITLSQAAQNDRSQIRLSSMADCSVPLNSGDQMWRNEDGEEEFDDGDSIPTYISDFDWPKGKRQVEVVPYAATLTVYICICQGHWVEMRNASGSAIGTRPLYVPSNFLFPFTVLRSATPEPVPPITPWYQEAIYIAILSSATSIAFVVLAYFFIRYWRKKYQFHAFLSMSHREQIARMNIESTNKFAVVKKIGSGGNGDVFLVRRKTDRVQFAVKHVKLKLNRSSRELSLRETDLMSSLKNHPNVVSTIETSLNEKYIMVDPNSSNVLDDLPNSLLVKAAIQTHFVRKQRQRLIQERERGNAGGVGGNGGIMSGGGGGVGAGGGGGRKSDIPGGFLGDDPQYLNDTASRRSGMTSVWGGGGAGRRSSAATGYSFFGDEGDYGRGGGGGGGGGGARKSNLRNSIAWMKEYHPAYSQHINYQLSLQQQKQQLEDEERHGGGGGAKMTGYSHDSETSDGSHPSPYVSPEYNQSQVPRFPGDPSDASSMPLIYDKRNPHPGGAVGGGAGAGKKNKKTGGRTWVAKLKKKFATNKVTGYVRDDDPRAAAEEGRIQDNDSLYETAHHHHHHKHHPIGTGGGGGRGNASVGNHHKKSSALNSNKKAASAMVSSQPSKAKLVRFMCIVMKYYKLGDLSSWLQKASKAAIATFQDTYPNVGTLTGGRNRHGGHHQNSEIRKHSMMDYGGGSSTNRHVADNQQPTKSIRKDKRRNSSAGSSEGGGSESGKVVPSSFMERISNRFGRGSNTSTANAGQHSNSSASAGGGGGVLGSPTLSYGGVDNNNRNSRSPSEFSVEGGALGGRDGGDSDGVEVVARVAPTPHQRMWALIVDHNTSNGLIIKTIGVGGVLPANSSTAPKPPTYNGVSSYVNPNPMNNYNATGSSSQSPSPMMSTQASLRQSRGGGVPSVILVVPPNALQPPPLHIKYSFLTEVTQRPVQSASSPFAPLHQMPYFPPYILQHLKTTPHPQQDLFLSSRHLLGFRPKLMFQIQQKYGNAAVMIPPSLRTTSNQLRGGNKSVTSTPTKGVKPPTSPGKSPSTAANNDNSLSAANSAATKSPSATTITGTTTPPLAAMLMGGSTSQNLSKFHLDAPSVASTINNNNNSQSNNNNSTSANAAANNSTSAAAIPAPSPEEVQTEANRRVGKIREQLQIALEDALTCSPKTPDVVAEPIVVSVALQVLSVLQCLHHTRPNPMAHCDIKLENILVADTIEAEFGNVGAPPSLVRGSFKLHHESGTAPSVTKGAGGGAGKLTMQANEKIAADNQVGSVGNNRNDFMPIMPMINATMGGSALRLPGANGEHFNTIEEAREYHKKRIMEVDNRRQKEIRDRERELHRLLNTQLALPSSEMVFGGGRQVNFKVDLAELVQDDLTTDLVPGGIPVPSIMEIIQKSNRDLAIAKQKRRASRQQHLHDDGYSEDEDGNAKKRHNNNNTDDEDDVEPSPAFVTTISAVITPTIHVPPPSLFLPIVVTDLGLAIEIPRPPPNVLYQYVIAHEHFETEFSNVTSHKNNVSGATSSMSRSQSAATTPASAPQPTPQQLPQQQHQPQHTPVPFNYVDDPVDYDNGLLLPAFTLPYVAPECITSGLRNVSTKIDIWALGCVLYLIAAGKHDGMEYIDEHLDESDDDGDDGWGGDDDDDDTTHDGGETNTTGGGTRVNSGDNLDGYDSNSSSSSGDHQHQRRRPHKKAHRNNKKYQSGNTDEDSDDEDDIQAGFNTEDRMLLFNDNHLLGDGPSIMDGNYGGSKKDRNKIDVIMFEKAQHPRFQQRLIRELCDKRGYSIAFVSFVTSMLQVNPRDRPTADELLKRIHRVGVYEYRII